MLPAHPSVLAPEAIEARLVELWERTGDPALKLLSDGQPPHDGASWATEQDRHDWLATSLMDTFRRTADASVFALLFELSRPAFTIAIQGQLRRSSYHVDVQDVLQEVFLNIYRYPHRFLADRADAFRNWGHRIVRNTLLKFLRTENKRARHHSLDDDMQCADERTRSPIRAATEGEGAALVDYAYLLYLNLYLLHFHRLTAKEQRALTMVEIDGSAYREAARQLGIRLQNFKMVVFRGRRKIFRGMSASLAEMSMVSIPATAGPRVAAPVSRPPLASAGKPLVTLSAMPTGEPWPRGKLRPDRKLRPDGNCNSAIAQG